MRLVKLFSFFSVGISFPGNNTFPDIKKSSSNFHTRDDSLAKFILNEF